MTDRPCHKCDEFKSVDSFKIRDGYRVNTCNECVRKRATKNNRKIKSIIQEASGNCWWIEQYCYGVMNYEQKKRR
jgi:hypothetical protein